MCFKPYIIYLCESSFCPTTLERASEHPGPGSDRNEIYSRAVVMCPQAQTDENGYATCDRNSGRLSKDERLFIYPLACLPCRKKHVKKIKDLWCEHFEDRFYDDRDHRKYGIRSVNNRPLHRDWKKILHRMWEATKNGFWNDFTVDEQECKDNWRKKMDWLFLTKQKTDLFNVAYFPHEAKKKRAIKEDKEAAEAMTAITFISVADDPEDKERYEKARRMLRGIAGTMTPSGLKTQVNAAGKDIRDYGGSDKGNPANTDGYGDISHSEDNVGAGSSSSTGFTGNLGGNTGAGSSGNAGFTGNWGGSTGWGYQ